MVNTTVDLDLKTMQQVAACGYEPIERKGRGTYGFVYEVGDMHGNLFAFKYVLPDGDYLHRGLDSLNEIDILSRVHHPHIIHAVRVITSHNCQIDGTAIILPLADRTLFDIIRGQQYLVTEEKLPVLFKLATALEFLHRSRILHLDIKSTNAVLQGNTPYLIDFGLSMVVDDVVVGKYDAGIKVTLDYRAPEILAGGRIYNAAVDVWAFGIMMLYILSNTGIYNVDFSKISDQNLYEVVTARFSDPNTLPTLLAGVRTKYQMQCFDLLSRILQINPTQRITAREICDHPLFDEFRQPIDGFLDLPPIAHDYAPDHRDILKLMIHWAQALYSSSRAELLFLAVDLFNRTSSFYKDRQPLDRMGLAATCLWVAAKLTDSPMIPLNIYVPELLRMVPGITAAMILNDEIEIIHLLSGVLNVSQLYSASKTGDELKLSLNHIILSRDSTLYARTDILRWILTMEQYITVPVYKDKNITITELLA